MLRRVLVLGIALVGAAGVAAVGLLRSPSAGLEVAVAKQSADAGPSMCPWREPARDLAAYYPGADAYTVDILVLSPLRRQILARLGQGGAIESNALYVYRVREHGRPRGTVVVRRANGEYGAIEVVLALDTKRRVVGVRVQRHREPAAIARFVASGGWLSAFRGKTAASGLRAAVDLPVVPPVARTSADSIAAAVRSILVEVDVAETMGAGRIHEEGR